METKPMNRGELLGIFNNEWRGRIVRIYADADDPESVITEGTPIKGAPVVCRERLSDYSATLQRIADWLPEMYTYR